VFLTLEIVSGPSTASLPTQSHTFGIEGGAIGRSPDNAWQIPYEFIHSKHAGIRFFNGLFYVEKLGSNVVAIGAPTQDLKTGDSFPLLDGSRLFLDEFELAVKVSSEAPGAGRVAMQSPPEFDARFTETGVHAPIPELQSPLSLGGDGGSRLDDFLRDPTPPPVAPRGLSGQVEHLDGIYDHMSMSAGHASAPMPSAPAPDMFADGWDRTNFTPPKPRAAPPPPPPPVAPRQPDPAPYYDRTGSRGVPQPSYEPPARGAPPPYDRTGPGVSPPGQDRTGSGWNAPPPAQERTGPGWHAPQPAQERTGPGWNAPPPGQDRTGPGWNAPPPPYDRTGPGGSPPAGYDRTGPGWGPAPPPVASHAPPHAAAYAPPHAPAHAPPHAPAHAPPHAGPVPRELAGLLAAFGVDPALLAPGDLEAFGRALRQAVAGTISTLQNRSEMRARFRLAGTQMAHGDPNPLKVAPNVDDAMHEFFRRRQPGKMPLDVAVGSALEEVQWHQLAMLDAMEVAFNGVLDRLDPASIEEHADKGGRRGALSSRAAHLWETFGAVHRQMAADRAEAYRKYFGADFSRAYDQALERRRTAARNTRR
jgi:predicted component of type VI protein secretion system